MRKKLDKTTQEFNMMQDFWKYWQDYYEPEDNDKYWSDLVSAGDELMKKYEECKLINQLVYAIQQNASDRYKNTPKTMSVK